jgi:hypothetical protein
MHDSIVKFRKEEGNMKTVMTFSEFKTNVEKSPDKYTLDYTECFRDSMLGIIGFEFDDNKKNTFVPILLTTEAINVIVRNN